MLSFRLKPPYSGRGNVLWREERLDASSNIYSGCFFHLHHTLITIASLPLYLMQKELSAGRLSVARLLGALSMSQNPMQANQNELEKHSLIAKNLRHPLQNESDCLFIEHVTPYSSLQLHIPLGNFLSSMPNFRYVLRDLGGAHRKQTSVNSALRTLAGFGCCTKEGSKTAATGLLIHSRIVF